MRRGVFLLCIMVISFGLQADGAVGRERAFFVEERIALKNIPPGLEDLRIWIPYPVNDEHQTIRDFKVASPLDADLIIEKLYGNRIVYLFKPKQKILDKGAYEMTLSFKVQRREYSISDDTASPYDMSLFLKADRLVPVNGRIAILAKEITRGKGDGLEKVRAIYDYIIDELTYSKDDPDVCGIGDSLLTLEHKKGICTDYHSLFISLVRSLGIPAKFEIGFRIPEDVRKGKIDGYHCWAKFYINGKGWVPVDISEADKNPEKRDYFFGHIDENRVHMTTGRDIRLEYAKNREPLNFFIFPYVEINDMQFNDIEISFNYMSEGR